MVPLALMAGPHSSLRHHAHTAQAALTLWTWILRCLPFMVGRVVCHHVLLGMGLLLLGQGGCHCRLGRWLVGLLMIQGKVGLMGMEPMSPSPNAHAEAHLIPLNKVLVTETETEMATLPFHHTTTMTALITMAAHPRLAILTIRLLITLTQGTIPMGIHRLMDIASLPMAMIETGMSIGTDAIETGIETGIGRRRIEAGVGIGAGTGTEIGIGAMIGLMA